ncbi:MAG: ABC transporter permease [Alphaproteobacteria bacterium]
MAVEQAVTMRGPVIGPRIAALADRARHNVIPILACAMLLLLVGAPVAMVVLGSLRGPFDYLPFEPKTFWTIQNYIEVFTSEEFSVTFHDTGLYALGAVSVALGFGVTIGWLVGRTDLPFRRVIFVMMLFPILMPPVIGAISWMLLLNPDAGYINIILRNVFWWLDAPGPINPFTLGGMIIVQGMSIAPLTYLLTVTSVTNLDPGLEEASFTSGAGFWRTMRHVTLPVLRPALLATTIVTMIFAIEGIDVPILLGIGAGVRVISLEAYRMLNPSTGIPEWGHVLALAMFYLCIAYAMFIGYQRLTARAERFATISGKGFRPRPLPLGRWRWVALTPVVLYLALQVFFPFFILAWTSLHHTYVAINAESIRTLTFDSYRALFADPRLGDVVLNTVMVGIGSATLVTCVTAIVAWVVVRSKSMLRIVLDLLASSSIAVPAVIAAVALLVFYLTVPNPVYGTIWVLVLTYSYRTAVSYRLHRATMTQIGRELEESSLASGATPRQTLFRIVLPLMVPGLFMTWMLLFIIAAREFTIPMLFGQQDMLGPFLYYKLAQLGQATALATLTLIFIGGGAVVLYRFGLARARSF